MFQHFSRDLVFTDVRSEKAETDAQRSQYITKETLCTTVIRLNIFGIFETSSHENP